MVHYHLAYTAPINPPSASPVLTVPQVWAGLQRKIRFAQEFVSAITDCEVLSEENGVVTRVVKFKPGMGASPSAKEVVTTFGNAWVSGFFRFWCLVRGGREREGGKDWWNDYEAFVGLY
jgi:hypothetical protein